jgi:hypothetical protein
MASRSSPLPALYTPSSRFGAKESHLFQCLEPGIFLAIDSVEFHRPLDDARQEHLPLFS